LPVALLIAAICPASCERGQQRLPSVAITEVPPAGEGGPDRVARIAGRVDAVQSGATIILFAKSGIWYVQPFRKQPTTTIRRDGTWSSSIHLGSEYAALLVRDGYQPPSTVQSLPEVGGNVLAVTRVRGAGDSHTPVSRTIDFSGYQWEIRQRPSERGGYNQYDSENVRVGGDGALHLSLSNRAGTWTSAEVNLTRTLGYGTYTFTVRDLAAFDQAALLTFFTYDESGPPDTFREMDIELQRSDPRARVAGRYVLQPFYIASNLARFTAPTGRSTYSFRWEPGRVVFANVPGGRQDLNAAGNAEREFTVGVPAAGQEHIGINLCYFRKASPPPRGPVEVLIERFQYFP
jgi:hypothetical protein